LRQLLQTDRKRKKKEDIFKLFIFAKTVNGNTLTATSRELGMEVLSLEDGTFLFHNIEADALTITFPKLTTVTGFAQVRYQKSSVIHYTTSSYGDLFDEGRYTSFEIIGEGVPGIEYSPGIEIGSSTPPVYMGAIGSISQDEDVAYIVTNKKIDNTDREIVFEKKELLPELIDGGEVLTWKNTITEERNLNTLLGISNVKLTSFCVSRDGKLQTIRGITTAITLPPPCNSYGAGGRMLREGSYTPSVSSYSLTHSWFYEDTTILKEYDINTDGLVNGEYTRGKFIGLFNPSTPSDFVSAYFDHQSDYDGILSSALKKRVAENYSPVITLREDEEYYTGGTIYNLNVGETLIQHFGKTTSGHYLSQYQASGVANIRGIMSLQSGTIAAVFNGSVGYNVGGLYSELIENVVGNDPGLDWSGGGSIDISLDCSGGVDFNTSTFPDFEELVGFLKDPSATARVSTYYRYPGIPYTRYTYPQQIVIRYPFYADRVVSILKSFTAHDQGENITISGVKYVTKLNMSLPTSISNPEVIHWKIIMSSPEAQDVDITEQVRRAFSVQREDGTWDDTEFMSDFALIYFYGYKKTTVIEEIN